MARTAMRARARRLLALPVMGSLASGLRVARFRGYRLARNVRYRHFGAARPGPDDHVADLERDGVTVLPGWVDADALDAVHDELLARLEFETGLEPAWLDARAIGGIDAPRDFVSAADLARGPAHYRGLTNGVSVAEPLWHCPSIRRIVLDEHNLELATRYLVSPAAVGGVDLRVSFVNSLEPAGDLFFFHSDPNSPRMLKFFYFLYDVTTSADGPFRYVLGSHRESFPGRMGRYLWTQEEMEARYGADRVIEVTARRGDVVVADPSGLHTGGKPHARDRELLVVNYVCHPEFGGRHPWLRIPASVLEGASPAQRHAADYLRVVD